MTRNSVINKDHPMYALKETANVSLVMEVFVFRSLQVFVQLDT